MNKSPTAGQSNNVTVGLPLVCAQCGCDRYVGMMVFDYEVHDYPIQHPDRCLKMDDKVFEHIIEDGEPRPHWRCRKKAGHPGACSSHNDCGELGGEHGHTVCGLVPGHKGPHAWERLLTRPEALSAEREEWLIWSNEHRAWWGPNNCGYPKDVSNAGRYTFAEAREICTSRSWESVNIPPETMIHLSAVVGPLLANSPRASASEEKP